MPKKVNNNVTAEATVEAKKPAVEDIVCKDLQELVNEIRVECEHSYDIIGDAKAIAEKWANEHGYVQAPADYDDNQFTPVVRYAKEGDDDAAAIAVKYVEAEEGKCLCFVIEGININVPKSDKKRVALQILGFKNEKIIFAEKMTETTSRYEIDGDDAISLMVDTFNAGTSKNKKYKGIVAMLIAELPAEAVEAEEEICNCEGCKCKEDAPDLFEDTDDDEELEVVDEDAELDLDDDADEAVIANIKKKKRKKFWAIFGIVTACVVTAGAAGVAIAVAAKSKA